jgi:nudix motif 8
LRETSEEVGIEPSRIDILGQYSALPNKTGSLRVHPYIGFIKDQVDLNKFNPDEVASVFTLPIDYLIKPEAREVKQFRDSKHKYTVFKVPKHIEGEKEIWGLTSFILDGSRKTNILNCWILTSIHRCVSQDHSRALFKIDIYSIVF